MRQTASTALVFLLALCASVQGWAQAAQPNIIFSEGDLLVQDRQCADANLGIDAGCTSTALQDVPSGGLALRCTGSAYYEVRDVEGSGESFQLKNCEAGDIEEVTFAGTIDCSGAHGVTRSSNCIPRP